MDKLAQVSSESIAVFKGLCGVAFVGSPKPPMSSFFLHIVNSDCSSSLGILKYI